MKRGDHHRMIGPLLCYTPGKSVSYSAPNDEKLSYLGGTEEGWNLENSD